MSIADDSLFVCAGSGLFRKIQKIGPTVVHTFCGYIEALGTNLRQCALDGIFCQKL